MRLRFTVTSAALGGQQFELDAAEPITVGRTGENRLVLDHRSVSRRHARIEANGGAFRLVDLDSHNGTLVGDEPVAERVVQPGDLLGFGEIRLQFAVAEAPEAAAATAGLPAIAAPRPGPEMAVARPLSVQDIFAQAAPTQPVEPAAAAASRVRGTLLYALTVVGVVVLGVLAYWRVGYLPPKPPIRAIQLRAGEVLPVNVAGYVAPSRDRWVPGLARAEHIGEPDDERVAYATKTRFPTFVTVRGRSVGMTDIPVYGPPLGQLTLRVLVRGVKPPPEADAWVNAPPQERRRRALDLFEQARLLTRRSGAVDEHTGTAIRYYELAAKLLYAIEGEGARAADAARKAGGLREARDRRYEDLAQRIEILRQEGNFKDADAAAQDLLRIYPDPETEEYHVVRSYYESLRDEMAESQREQEAQERR